jgi:hypothetical protein
VGDPANAEKEAEMSAKKINVGFQKNGSNLLGFEIKISNNADIFMLIFERGHRRMHISYHSNGRIHYKADRPHHDAVYIESDYPTGKMEPVAKHEIRPQDVVTRQEVGVTGWGMEDVGRAGLNKFVPGPEDILVIQPKALSLGFRVSVVGPQASSRATSGEGIILERRYIQGAVRVEIEVFDWLVSP